MDAAGRRYLIVAGFVCGVSMVLGPPMPEHRMLRHLKRIERIIDRHEPREAEDLILAYSDRHGRGLDRVKEQLRRYNSQRAQSAYRRIERRIESLQAVLSTYPQMGESVRATLLDLLP